MPAFVLFTVADQTFALPAAQVAQVLRMAAPTAVPGAPPWLRGVLNVHGALVPVVDVATRLGHPPRPMRPERQLVLADAGGRRVALEVDQVLEVRELPEEAVVSRGAFAPGTALVAGAARVSDGVVLVQELGEWLAGDAGGSAHPA
jgi:purine-binding chemotaxis protein CheW